MLGTYRPRRPIVASALDHDALPPGERRLARRRGRNRPLIRLPARSTQSRLASAYCTHAPVEQELLVSTSIDEGRSPSFVSSRFFHSVSVELPCRVIAKSSGHSSSGKRRKTGPNEAETRSSSQDGDRSVLAQSVARGGRSRADVTRFQARPYRHVVRPPVPQMR